MVTLIVGDYLPMDGEQESRYHPDIVHRNSFNRNMVYVVYAEVSRLTKEIIKYIIDYATSEIKIVCNDERLIKGIRKSKKCEIIKMKDDREKINDFELAKIILTFSDRQYLLQYLLDRKPNLWFICKVLTSNYSTLTDVNKKALMFLDRYLFKVDQEIIYHFVAFWFKTQQCVFLKWNFPKEKEETGD